MSEIAAALNCSHATRSKTSRSSFVSMSSAFNRATRCSFSSRCSSSSGHGSLIAAGTSGGAFVNCRQCELKTFRAIPYNQGRASG